MVGFIFAMNFVFGILEEVGYMARVSYVFDRSMGKIGLQGKALMPMIMGFGCTMGSTSGARVIDSYGQKIMTIAVAWAVPCGATFVVIPTLANAFFGTGGGMLVMLLIFLIMLLHIIITAKVFGKKLNPVGSYKLSIDGMHCQNCVKRITEAVNNIDGLSCRVSLEKKEEVISYEEKPMTDEVIKLLGEMDFLAIEK